MRTIKPKRTNNTKTKIDMDAVLKAIKEANAKK